MFLRSFAAAILLATSSQAAELVMVEEQGCYHCLQWKKEIGDIYPKSSEGAYAPLRMVDIDNGPPEGVTFARKVLYTPTFILIENGQELGRIEGYPGEDFFWGLLDMMLRDKTDYDTDKTG
ncbi:MAG: hypothetical protein CSA70_01515 [Rhodobacterales bacterium]|nr:MAG: hypothetical protein CSA70_01515 [Rhodobacterales bacterium]